MITFTVVASTRRTSRTLNSCSRPNNTDVASDMLVAPLLDVVRDQQHVGATSPSPATTRASKHPAQVRRTGFPGFLHCPDYRDFQCCQDCPGACQLSCPCATRLRTARIIGERACRPQAVRPRRRAWNKCSGPGHNRPLILVYYRYI